MKNILVITTLLFGLSVFAPSLSLAAPSLSAPPTGSISVVPLPGGTGGEELCNGGKGIQTAIGCVPFDSDDAIARFFLRWGLGIGGGIAFILIVFSSYQIITSTGDPRKLQAGKELLTAAISGLILLVFSAFILRFIGVDLLGVI